MDKNYETDGVFANIEFACHLRFQHKNTQINKT